ncbi:MAG: hypothetical protein AAF267_01390 [Deinococcota bacterium]
MYERIEPLSSFDRKRLVEVAERSLLLPTELGKERGKLTALRAEKRNLEVDIKKRIIAIKAELVDDDDYQALRNNTERQTRLDEVCQLDISLKKMNTRVLQLAVSIDVATANIATLEDERKVNYGVLCAYHAAVLHDTQLERELASATHKGRVAAA